MKTMIPESWDLFRVLPIPCLFTDSRPIPAIFPSVNTAHHIIPMATTFHIGAVLFRSVIVWLVGSPVGEDNTLPGRLKFPVAFWMLVSDAQPDVDGRAEVHLGLNGFVFLGTVDLYQMSCDLYIILTEIYRPFLCHRRLIEPGEKYKSVQFKFISYSSKHLFRWSVRFFTPTKANAHTWACALDFGSHGLSARRTQWTKSRRPKWPQTRSWGLEGP